MDQWELSNPNIVHISRAKDECRRREICLVVYASGCGCYGPMAGCFRVAMDVVGADMAVLVVYEVIERICTIIVV